MSGKGDECVKVVVRCRPPNAKEIREGRKSIVKMNTEISEIVVDPTHGEDEAKKKRFTYDAVYDENSTQRMVYDETAFPLVESVLDGFNGTIFAYGQTGCGKTWTMTGIDEPEELRGVIPNSFEHIFEYIKLAEASTETVKREFLVRASYLEIYQEDIRDLLGANPKQRMEVKESPDLGVYVKNLTFKVVENKSQIDKVLEMGSKRRSVGETNMNEASSRSHAIFGIVIEVNEVDEEGNNHLRAGKLNLVDLAGSERQSKTGASGGRLREGAKINLSLTALGNVISALIDGKGKHIPYRDSKLTRLLQDSLGGNTKTVMISAISPADYNYEETMSTLRYANRAKNIKNKPVINEDPKDALLRTYKEEIEALKKMLEQQEPTTPDGNVVKEIVEVEKIVHVPVQDESLNQELNKRAAEISQKVDEIEQERRMREELEDKLRQLQSQVLGKRKKKKKKSKRDRSNSIASKNSSASLGTGSSKGDSDDEEDPELAIARQHREYRTRQYSMTASRKKEAARQYAARETEMEMAAMEGVIETKERAVKVLKQKLMAQAKRAENEIQDLEEEFQTERESLLNTIREQGRDITLLEQLVEVFLPPSEVSKVWELAHWDPDRAKWKLPRIRPRKDYNPISLPGLPKGGGGEVLPDEPDEPGFEESGGDAVSFGSRASSQGSAGFDPMGTRGRTDSRGAGSNHSRERRSSGERPNIHTAALSPMDHSRSEMQAFDRVSSAKGGLPLKRQQVPRELEPITGAEEGGRAALRAQLDIDSVSDKFVDTDTRQPMTKISPLKR